MAKYLLEVACTGNNGRSPIIEVVGNHLIKELDLEGVIKFISSGVQADPKYDGNWNYEKVMFVNEKAKRACLKHYDPIDQDRFENDVEYSVIVIQDTLEALKVMRQLETAFRDAALFNKYVHIYAGERLQTMPFDEVNLVLGVNDKHVAQIKEIYAGRDDICKIHQLNKYAELDGSISDCLGNFSVGCYEGVIKQAETIMPKVIERFRTEHGI